MSIKHAKGKLPEAGPLLSNYDASIRRLRAEFLPITHIHGLLAGEIRWSHRDPFDRMLAAQAMLENARLVSLDRVFDTLPGLQRLW
jgi:PIN domain nuclease of toxin-antitoxin system